MFFSCIISGFPQTGEGTRTRMVKKKKTQKKKKLRPGGSMKFICIGRVEERLSGDLVYCLRLRTHCSAHWWYTWAWQSGRQETNFYTSFLRVETHSDDMHIMRGLFSVRNNGKTNVFKANFTGNNERADLTSVTTHTWADDAESHRVILKSLLGLWVIQRISGYSTNCTAVSYTCRRGRHFSSRFHSDTTVHKTDETFKECLFVVGNTLNASAIIYTKKHL